MPRKKREIRQDYHKAGFTEVPGKGSHTVFRHPLVKRNYPVAGHDGDDAKKYDEDNLHEALQALRESQKEQRRKKKS